MLDTLVKIYVGFLTLQKTKRIRILVILYDTRECHNYSAFLKTHNMNYAFLDIAENEVNAQELYNVDQSKKLIFLQLLLAVKIKKPSDKNLQK